MNTQYVWVPETVDTMSRNRDGADLCFYAYRSALSAMRALVEDYNTNYLDRGDFETDQEFENAKFTVEMFIPDDEEDPDCFYTNPDDPNFVNDWKLIVHRLKLED